MINNWYRDMNPPPSCSRPNQEGGCDCGGLDCLCPSCVAGRAALGEEGAEAAIAEAIRGKELITEQLDEVRKLIESGALRRREPLILPYDPPAVHGVTGPPVSAGGHPDMIPGPAGPFGVIRVREVRPGVWVPARDDGGLSQEQADEITVATAAKDPAAEIMLALSEPLGLSARELTEAIPDQPPGTCSQCHTGPRARNGADPLCWACLELHKLRVAASPVAAELTRRAPPCTHGKNAAWVRDGRCARCGRYANARPVPVTRRKPGVVPVIAFLMLGMAVLYAIAFTNLPLLLVTGILLMFRLIWQAGRRL